MEQPVLETERLILSPFVDDDAQRLSELAGDKAVSDTTLRIPYPYDVTEALEWIRTHAKIRERELALYYAVILKDSGELIGSAGIDIELPHGRAELGYWTGREFWRNGYATEASAKLLSHSFAVLKLHKVSAHVFASNLASGRVLEKLGMSREGHLRDHIRKSDVWEDIIEYGILEDEYRRLENDLQRSG